MNADCGRFDPAIVLGGARIAAVRLDRTYIVRDVHGNWCDIPVGADIRDTIPALIGMEEELERDTPEIDLPFVTLQADDAVPIEISAIRDHSVLWILIRDVSKEAATQRRLVQQHNALSIAQRELSAARDAALAADRAKTAFLANISHELRTPLNVVIGGASILLKPRNSPLPADESAAFVRDIHDAGDLLLRLVNDLIDLSRAETGNLILYDEWCSIPAIAHDIIRLVRALPAAADMTIKFVATEPVPEIQADPTRLKQILLNLLSNAVKACGPGSTVLVDASVVIGGDLLLTVTDDGPGMSARDLSIALEPFGQPKSSNREQGAGLGLAIVQRLVQLHGGRFEIQSQPGEGLVAKVRLPASRFTGANSV